MFDEGKGDRRQIKVYTADELCRQKFTVLFYVNDILVAGEPMILAGARKSLKTTLAIELGLSIAGARQFLGKFWVPNRARVMMLSGESRYPTLKETALRISREKDIDFGALGDQFLLGEWLPKLSRLDDLDALGQLLEQFEVEVLILDPAYLCLGRVNTASLAEVGDVLTGLTAVCREAGATPVLLHHMRKPSKESRGFPKPTLDEITGAGFQEYARQWILLGRRQEYVAGTGEHRLWFVTGGSVGHGDTLALDVNEGCRRDPEGRRWEVKLATMPELAERTAAEKAEEKAAKAEGKLCADMNAVAQALAEVSPSGETKDRIRKCDGVVDSAGRVEKAIEALKAVGVVEPCEVQRGNNQIYPGWRLRAGHATGVGQTV